MTTIVLLLLLLLVQQTSSFVRFVGGGVPVRRYDASLSAGAAPVIVPPSTFLDCVKQSVTATKKAMEKGTKLMEVEFPPLPLEYLEDSASSARDIANANTRWAVEYAKSFAEMGRVSILFPDQAELDDAIIYVGEQDGGANPFPNVTLATARSDSIKNAKSLDQMILSVFGATVGGTVEPVPDTKMYVALVSSTQELPDLEKLHSLDPSIPIVFFNLRLDILRGDLGLPLFPGRDLHHRFLSKVLPVYLMRSRSFATSLRRPPFIINYSGLLFRAFPEPYQCILNTGNNRNKLVKYMDDRPTNMDFRDALTDGLNVPNVPREELRSKGNLVWWEKELEKESEDTWRK